MQKQLTTHIAFAGFIGTAIEFYDFYIYAMAEALMTGQVFFLPVIPLHNYLIHFYR